MLVVARGATMRRFVAPFSGNCRAGDKDGQKPPRRRLKAMILERIRRCIMEGIKGIQRGRLNTTIYLPVERKEKVI